MINERIDPEGHYLIPGLTHATVATGSRIIHVSGQTGVDGEGKVVGTTHLDQTRQAFRNMATVLDAAGTGPADIAKMNIYMVDYSEKALEALMTAAVEVFGEDFPITASTLIGVATLWQPDLLVEIDCVAIV